MNTIGYVMLFSALLIINSIARGRVMHLFEDLGDAFTAAITGDYAELRDILTKSGDDLQAETVAVSADVAQGTTPGGSGAIVLAEMKRLAVIAHNTYRLGTTGPNAYDCSGLVWRACKNIGVYTGSRFTTHTFTMAARSFCDPVDTPQVGDIVLWPNRHMGVVSGPDTFFSARSTKSGIGEAKIAGFHNIQPRFFRISTFSLNPIKGTYGQGLGVLK